MANTSETEHRDSIVMPKGKAPEVDVAGLERQSVVRLGFVAVIALLVQAFSYIIIRGFNLLPKHVTSGDIGGRPALPPFG